jgi:hypothetical protein
MSVDPYKHVPENIRAFKRYFNWDHLPPALQVRSAPFEHLAHTVMVQASAAAENGSPPDWAEVMVGLRSILIAKDNIVRAFLPR